ncbi:MAG TPA: transglutaminase-like domain-containing protein [Flavisolibacter sp.]|nr:transglutaminase-like domain-containing protein [Flavisolibacter sp.]
MTNCLKAALLPFCLLAFVFLQARPPSEKGDNIILTSSVETFRYEYSKAKNCVEIKAEVVNKYTCRNFRDKGVFFEFFDDQTVLDNVELYEDGSKRFAHQDLKDYSVEDIFYSDAKVYNLELTFPKSGWQNEVRLKKTIKDPRYFCNIFFPEAYPVAHKEIIIIVPRWVKADIKEFNFDGYEVIRQQQYSEKEGADVYTFIIKNLSARKSEPRQPGATHVLPHLLMLNKSAAPDGQSFTFFNTLADQYAWYRKIVGLCRNDAAVIKAKALEITAASKTDMDKIKAVLYWVYNNIRYVAFEDGLAGFKPDEAQNVLNKKYGDCKGMANLTKELLSSLGFDARLAWIGTSRIRYDYSTPALCVDNHMICCLIYKGNKYFLDGTERYLPVNNYAERIQGRQVLVENGETFLLEQIPVTKPDQNLCQFKETLHVQDNALVGQIEYLYRGESKQNLYHSIHSTKKEKLEAQLERYISNENKNYFISGVQTADLNEVDGDLWIRFGVKNAAAVSSFGNELYIDIDYNKTFNGLVIDSTRSFDYCFSYKHSYNTETSLQLPQGYKLTSVPKDFEVRHPDFYMAVSFKADNNTVRYKKQLQIHNTTIRKASFKAWNSAVEQLSASYLDQIILTKN